MMDASSSTCTSAITEVTSDSCSQSTSCHQKDAEITLKNLLMNENASLVLPLDDSQFLLKFLRPCNYNVEDAQRRIVKYYSFQFSHPEVFSSVVDETIRFVFESNILWISPVNTDKSNQPVLLFNPGQWNVDVITFDAILNAFIMTIEILCLSVDVQRNGVIAIIDTSDVSWGHIKSFAPSHAKKVITLVEEVIPCRITHIHLVNRSQLAKMAVQVIKPFLNPELTARSKLHSDYQSLKCCLGSNVLPIKLGGDLHTINPSIWFDKLQADKDVAFKYWSANSEYGSPRDESSSQQSDATVCNQNCIVRQLTGKKEPLMDNLPKLPSCVASFFR